MRIAVLSDNRTHDPKFETEHGLAVYVEWKNKKWLLDTGKSDLCIRNAEKMNIDLSAVDYVFISHGHNDHTGGLVSFLEKNKKAKVFISKNAFYRKLYSRRTGLRDISMPEIPDGLLDRIIPVDDHLSVENDVTIFTTDCAKYPEPVANKSLLSDRGLGLEQDNFNHEQIIAFGNELSLIYTGCSHKGLLNILESCKYKNETMPRRVLGGFHFPDPQDNVQYEIETELISMARTLNIEYANTRFYTGHCTGQRSFDILKSALNNRIEMFYAGFDLLINE